MSSTKLPLMEAADSNSQASPAPADGSRRRSGRVVRAPQKFAPDAAPSSKRKRAADRDNEDAENEEPGDDDDDDDDEAPSDDDDDDMVDDDEPAPAKRRKKPAASQSKERALKKPKTNGTTLGSGAHASSLPRRPKKAVRVDVAHREGDGIFGSLVTRVSRPRYCMHPC